MKKILMIVLSAALLASVAILGAGCDEKHVHEFAEKNVKDEYLYSDATCTDSAKYYYSCKCGEKGAETFDVGYERGHNYIDDVCNRCGKINVFESHNLEFTLSEDQSYYIVTEIGTELRPKFSIPSVHNDKPVKSIGEEAFSGRQHLTSVAIPDSITSIGDSAFRGCSSLIIMTIPDSITSIGVGAFSGCKGLKSITIPDSVTSIGGSAINGERDTAEMPQNLQNKYENSLLMIA